MAGGVLAFAWASGGVSVDGTLTVQAANNRAAQRIRTDTVFMASLPPSGNMREGLP